MATTPLKPRGQRAATFLGAGVLVALLGLLLQSAGVKSGVVVGGVIAFGGVIVLGAAAYWIVTMATGRGG